MHPPRQGGPWCGRLREGADHTQKARRRKARTPSATARLKSRGSPRRNWPRQPCVSPPARLRLIRPASGGNARSRSLARRDIKGVVDFAYLEQFAAGDETVVDEVLELFREQSAIWGAMLTPANEGWRDGVHTLKGAARGVGRLPAGRRLRGLRGGRARRPRPGARRARRGARRHRRLRPRAGAELAEDAEEGLTRVLLIKTSSLGDVIHCLPAVSDMSREVPGPDARLGDRGAAGGDRPAASGGRPGDPGAAPKLAPAAARQRHLDANSARSATPSARSATTASSTRRG